MKRGCLLILLFLLVLSVAGCNQNKPEESTSNSSAMDAQFFHQASFMPLIDTNQKMISIDDACINGEYIFYTAFCDTGSRVLVVDEQVQDPEAGETSLFVLRAQSDIPQLLVNAQSSGLAADASGSALDVLALTAGEEDSVWAYQQLYTYTTGSDGVNTPSVQTQLCRYNLSGEMLECKDLPDVRSNTVFSMLAVQDGFYLMDGGSIYLLDRDGNLLHTLVRDIATKLCMYQDQPGALCVDASLRSYFRPLSMETGIAGDDRALPEKASSLFPGIENYSYIFSCYGDAVYGMGEGDQTAYRLFSWSDYGVNSQNILTLSVLEDGSVLAVINERTQNSAEAVFLTSVDRSELPEVLTLRLACLNGTATAIQGDVSAFNRAHPDIHISLIDYQDFGSNANMLLNTEIMAGKAPDLYCMNSMNLNFLSEAHVLMDLWPLIDNDSEISRDDLVMEVMDVMSKDGHLYGVSPSFYIQTVALPAGVLDDPAQTSWTLSELKAAREKRGDSTYIFGNGDARAGILFRLVGHNTGDFIDYDKGEVYLNTPEFMEILEFAKEAPDTFVLPTDYRTWLYEEPARVRSGEQLCGEVEIRTTKNLQECLLRYGSDVQFLGWPSRTGGSFFRMQSAFAISASCSNRDAAWEFIRTFLTEAYQRGNMHGDLPTNRNIFERQRSTLTDKENEIFGKLLASCNRAMGYDDTMMDIIFDEAEYYFRDEKSVEEVAATIQDRVALYVAERAIQPS